jgi:uncharacterized protein with ATP-grasp and redox domains
MKGRVACLVCIVRQVYSAATVITRDESELLRILRATLDYVRNLPLGGSPAEMSSPAYFMLHEMTGVDDPFEQVKKRQNEIALSLYGRMKQMVRESPSPLRAAARLAVIGNAIDCGVGIGTDIVPEIKKGLEQDLAVDDFAAFAALLRHARTLLYVCDNAGEILFDRIFVEEMRAACPTLQVVAAVKPKAILNDAMAEDARAVGLDAVATIITTGSEYIGAPLDRISPEMRRLVEGADIIISKGQGNFETLDTNSPKTFFLLKAKCELVAEELGVPLNALVFQQGGRTA